MDNNEEDFFESEDDNEFEELLSKFENFVNNGEHHFFDSQDIVDLVDYYLGWKNKEMANKAIETGLHFYPNSTELLLKKAELLSQQNYTLEALKILNQIEPQLHNDPQFFLTKGNIYSQMGLSEQAISEYKKLLNTNYPNKEFVYNTIASEYMTQYKFHESIPYLKKSLEINPKNHHALRHLYVSYSEIDKVEECIEYLHQIIDNSPFNSDAWLYISLCYCDLKDYENAHESINFALAISPNDPLTIFKKSDILKELNKYNEAIELLKEALNKDPQETFFMYLLAKTYMEISDYEKAVKYFHKVLHFYSKDSRAWLGLAESFAHLSQENEAISCIQQAITNSNNDPEILLDAGKLYILIGMYEEAANTLKITLELGYDKTEIYVWLCIALEKSGYSADALNLLTDQIYNQQNKDVELQYCLAGILLLSQYRQEGLATLEKALQTDASKHTILYEFSQLFENDSEIQNLIQEYFIK